MGHGHQQHHCRESIIWHITIVQDLQKKPLFKTFKATRKQERPCTQPVATVRATLNPQCRHQQEFKKHPAHTSCSWLHPSEQSRISIVTIIETSSNTLCTLPTSGHHPQDQGSPLSASSRPSNSALHAIPAWSASHVHTWPWDSPL